MNVPSPLLNPTLTTFHLDLKPNGASYQKNWPIPDNIYFEINSIFTEGSPSLPYAIK